MACFFSFVIDKFLQLLYINLLVFLDNLTLACQEGQRVIQLLVLPINYCGRFTKWLNHFHDFFSVMVMRTKIRNMPQIRNFNGISSSVFDLPWCHATSRFSSNIYLFLTCFKQYSQILFITAKLPNTQFSKLICKFIWPCSTLGLIACRIDLGV